MRIIGAGRIGSSIAARANARGVPCALVTRTEGWDDLAAAAPGEPILVCTGADDLAGVLQKVPDRLRADLVFTQNGMLRGFLAEHQLPHATRGVLYLAATDRGGELITGHDSPFHGAHAPNVAWWFGKVGLPATTVDWARFSVYEIEKLLWLCAFGVVCQRHGCTVGQAMAQHAHLLEALVAELANVARAALGVDVDAEWRMARLIAWSARIPAWKAGVKEWPWRNGWFDQMAARFEIQTPLHRDLLRAMGKGDLLIERPDDPLPE